MIFGKKAEGPYPNGVTLSELKKNPKNFFNYIYRNEPKNVPGSDDGFTFRGRGFNQITSRGNYEGISNFSGKDYVTNPDALNDVEGASYAAAWYFSKDNPGMVPGIDNHYRQFAGSGTFKDATNIEAAIKAAAWANAGVNGSLDSAQGSIDNALAWKNILENTYNNDSTLQ